MTRRRLRGRDPAGAGGTEVTIEGGRIVAVDRVPDPGPEAGWLAPGLVDLQVNGHGTGDANADPADGEQIDRMATSLAGHGVTRFLPTVITAAPQDMLSRIRAVVAAAAGAGPASRMVAGIHVEGPFLSDQDGPRGAHPIEHIRPPRLEELRDWLAAARGMLRIVTLSPHHEGAAAATRLLVAHGVRVAIGHTHADEQQIAAVVDAGATLSTHLGNGAHAMLPRHPNYLWTQLAERRLQAGLIADGHHLPGSTLAAMLAAKRDHGCFLVSDAVATPATLTEGGRSSVGGQVRITPDGALRHVATGFLAGSVQTLDVGVATVAEVTGSLAEGVRLATTAPAALLDPAPIWAPGARADLLHFDWAPGDRSLGVREVLVAGRPVGS